MLLSKRADKVKWFGRLASPPALIAGVSEKAVLIRVLRRCQGSGRGQWVSCPGCEYLVATTAKMTKWQTCDVVNIKRVYRDTLVMPFKLWFKKQFRKFWIEGLFKGILSPNSVLLQFTWFGAVNIFAQLFGLIKATETHTAPILDQLRAFEQNLFSDLCIILLPLKRDFTAVLFIHSWSWLSCCLQWKIHHYFGW